MKLLFILPAIGKKPGQKYIGTWKMEPYTIAVLKALTPADVETFFYDDRIECIDYDIDVDLVAISVETYTAKRSYRIAAEFRQRGRKVVMGGYHVTLVPKEAAEYADSIVVGNAEGVWGQLISDFREGRMKARYDGGFSYTSRIPDKSIFEGKKYLPVSLVETGRGCYHSCEFCAISEFYERHYYRREHADILAEVERSRHKIHFLVDDNLFADPKNAMSLFTELIPHKITWAGQGTLSMAKDPALLTAMKKSGCELILIGFESLNSENLSQMNKSFNTALGERDELVKRIHDAGIGIYSTFIFGYDHDTEQTFDDTVAFALKHRFYTSAFNHLLPFPGTKLYDRFRREERLLYDKWWLEEGYRYGELAFQPKNMSPGKLSDLCRQARKEFSSAGAVLKRGLASMQRSSPLMWSLFWAMNLRLGEEIDEKMNVPIGENLDAMPK